MLFQRARLITCALIAKIHTVEWTPSVTAHPTAVEGLYANWWGLAGQKLHNFVAKISKNEALRGIPGTDTEDYGVPYSLTEEFVAVYRMHPLVPDDFDFRSARDDTPTLGPRSFSELTGPQAVPILRDQRLTDIIYTFGTMNPGLVTLHNFPKGLQTFKRPDNGAYMDMAALDILRCRELGVPRYCEFRRLLHMPVPQTFEEVTSNPVWAKELHDVYGGKIERPRPHPRRDGRGLPRGLRLQRHDVPHLRPDGLPAAQQRPVLHRLLHRRGLHPRGHGLDRGQHDALSPGAALPRPGTDGGETPERLRDLDQDGPEMTAGNSAAGALGAPAETLEHRLALVMNGGVSLAVWMGGVACEIDNVRRASNGMPPRGGATEEEKDGPRIVGQGDPAGWCAGNGRRDRGNQRGWPERHAAGNSDRARGVAGRP